MGVGRGIVAGIVYVCAFYILKPGILAVTSRVSGGDWKREAGIAGYDTNQCIVSIMAICAILLWHIPDDIVGGIAPSLMAALLMLLYVVYRSGASYGCGLAAAAGGILSVKTGNMGWIPLDAAGHGGYAHRKSTFRSQKDTGMYILCAWSGSCRHCCGTWFYM